MEKSTCTQRIVNDNTQQLISPVKAGYIERLDEKIFIKKGLNIIGREHYCHIVIPHEALSSKHALIYVEDAEKHFICDLKSTNGTKVNDELIANNAFHPLNDGDTVSFGGYEVIYFKLADGIGGVLDRSADDIQTTATQATENNDTNPLDDSFEFPSASEVDGIFEGSTNNFTIPETPPNQSTPKNLLLNQTTESRASTSFMNTEEESSLKNNSEASFNLMLEETYNSDTMLINCSDKETTKLVVDEPEKYSECPEPVKEQEIQHDLSSETIEKSKPNDPPDEADADTLLVNEDVFSEKEKNQTAIENLCTQVCDDHVSNIYAGVPQQSVGVTDETMNVCHEDSKEKESIDSEKCQLNLENCEPAKETSSSDDEDLSLLNEDLCSLPATQILQRSFPIKKCTRKVIKQAEPPKNLSNSENCKTNENHNELEEDTLVINEEISKKQTSIENLCTQVCEDQLSNVYAGVPQQLDGLMDETMIVGQEDSKEKETERSKNISNGHNTNQMVENSKSNEPSDELETLLITTEIPSVAKNNSISIENLCTQNCDEQTSNVYAEVPQQSVVVTDETMNVCQEDSKEKESIDSEKCQLNLENCEPAEETSSSDDEDLSLLNEDLCSLPATQILQRNVPIKKCSRKVIKQAEPFKNLSNGDNTNENCEPNEPHNELEEDTLLINEEISKEQTSIENLCTQVCEDQLSNVYAGVPQQLEGLMDETMMVLDTSLTPNQTICNDESVSSIKKIPKTVVDNFKSDLVTQAVCSNPRGTDRQVLSSIGKCNNIVSPPVESISRIPEFLSENKICVPSSSKTITTEVEDVKNDLLTQALFVKPNVPSKIKSSSVIGSPSESSVETMSQIQHFISNNKMCAPSSSKKINTEVEDVKNDLLTQAPFVKPNVPSKMKSSSVIGSPSESSGETMSQIQDFIAKDPSSRKQTNNEVENLKNDLLTQPIFIKPGPAPIQIKTSSVTNTSRELGTDEIPLSPLKSVETMSQINDFVLKNVSRKEKNASKETEVEDLKNDLSTQAICSNPQQTDPSVIENPIEADEIPGSPGRVESISQIQQFVSRSKTRSSSSPKKRESVAVESEINSKPKRTRAPSWKMKLANEDTSNEVTEKPAPRRGRPKKIIIDDDEIDDSSPEVIITKKTSRLMETKSSSRKSADNRRGKRKADVNTKESESSSGSSNASTSKYPKLEVTKSTIPATNDDMDLDIADMIKMRKRSASIRPGSLHPSEMNQFRHQNVIFTFMKSVELQNKVKKLGGTIGTSPTDCTVLVAEEVKRSVKFLCVLGLGKPIVTPKWIHDSFEANSFLDPMKYVLKDRKKETQFQFQLDCSLRKAKESPLLKNYSVFVTPSVKPPPSEMKEIIESCGGRFLPKVPLKWPTNSIVISCVDDEIIYKKWKSRVKSFPIIEAEGLITGILRQNLKFHQHLL